VTTKQNLSIIQGDSKTYTLTFRDAAGTALNITGWTVYFTVKQNYTDPDVSAILSKTVTVHTDPTHGITAIELEHADTENLASGNYFYSIQTLTNASKFYTLLRGNYKIEEVADRNS